jgi:hypothetical protein
MTQIFMLARIIIAILLVCAIIDHPAHDPKN